MGTILLVEDDHDIRAILCELLEYEGHEVFEARHGAEGLALLRGGLRPGIILLDLMMPVMDGTTFIDRLRGDRELVPVPILVLTAAHSPQLPAGIRVMAKPLDLEQLLTTVQAACG